MTKYVTIDLETMGTHPNSPVMQAAAVAWDSKTGVVLDTFQVNIDLEEEFRLGFRPEASTILWWLEQSDNARAALTKGQLRASKTKEALQSLTLWFKRNEQEDALVWTNGPAFDAAILSTHYHKFNAKVPWKFWNDACFRTLMRTKKFNPKKEQRDGVHHNALDDCLFQAKCIQKAEGNPWNPQ